MRALVVEDNLAQQERLSAILRELGFEVDVAANRKSALQYGREHQHDVAIIDIGLELGETTGGELGGVEVIRAFRQWGRDLPIVVWSRRADRETAARIRAAGIDAYLPKASGAERLVACLRSLIDDLPPDRKERP